MSTTTQKVTPRIIEILRFMEWQDGVGRITEQLDHAKEYKPTDKILQALGGKWDRKIKGHKFDTDGQLLVRSVIDTGEYIDPKQAFQFFESPDAVVERMCDMAMPLDGKLVLEPSAGKGAIIRGARKRGARVCWYELDASREKDLLQLYADLGYVNGVVGDFLNFLPIAEQGDLFDAVIMNPPFSKQQDIKHIQHAWKFIKPSGHLVAICSTSFTFRTNKASVEFSQWLREIGAEITELPAGTFKKSGTMVSTVMIYARK